MSAACSIESASGSRVGALAVMVLTFVNASSVVVAKSKPVAFGRAPSVWPTSAGDRLIGISRP